jgi:RNA polymerase sigma-70 factor, ECF subfamily
VSTSPFIPPATRVRSRCSTPKRAALSLVAPENGRGSSAPVLHCLPLQPLRGRSLQFQSFDEPYVGRLRAGDFRTQENFVAYFGALIQIKLRSRLQSREAIEDVRQETFVRFFAALRDGRILQPERLGSFVNSICNNVLLEHYRGDSHHDSLDDDDQQDFPAKEPGPLAIFVAKQTENKVREVLDQLPERDRRLLREVFLEERDKDEVCREFNVDRDYLRVLLYRAKKSFKSLYPRDKGNNGPELTPA